MKQKLFFKMALLIGLGILGGWGGSAYAEEAPATDAEKADAAWEKAMEEVDQALEQQDQEMEEIDIAMEQVDKAMQESQAAVEKAMNEIHPRLEKRLNRVMQNINQSLPLAMSAAGTSHEIKVPPIPPIPPMPAMPAMPAIPPMPPMKHTKEQFHGPVISETFEQTFPVQDGTELKVDSSFCSVFIQPGEDNSKIIIHVEKTAGADTEEQAKQLLKWIRVSAQESDKIVTLKIQLEKKEWKNQHILIQNEAKVLIPTRVPIHVKNSFGDVQIQKMEKGIECENSFGGLQLVQTRGDVDLHSQYGPLNIEKHNGKGKIRCGFGNLELNGWTGSLDLNVEYGNAKIQGIPKNAQIKGAFSFGKLDLVLPQDYSGKIEAFTSFGEIKAPTGLEKKTEMFSQSVKGEIQSGEGNIQVKGSYTPIEITLGDSE